LKDGSSDYSLKSSLFLLHEILKCFKQDQEKKMKTKRNREKFFFVLKPTFKTPRMIEGPTANFFSLFLELPKSATEFKASSFSFQSLATGNARLHSISHFTN
jgi:hypothetical protein